MNDDEGLQPMVKGDNLIECLEAIIQIITNLAIVLENYMTYDEEFKTAIQNHTHMTPFFGKEAAPDFKKLMMKGVENMINTTINCKIPQVLDAPLDVAGLLSDYLSGGAAPGPKYILSNFNKVN